MHPPDPAVRFFHAVSQHAVILAPHVDTVLSSLKKLRPYSKTPADCIHACTLTGVVKGCYINSSIERYPACDPSTQDINRLGPGVAMKYEL